ncbi:MAG: transcription antitermination factor NusB [Patescibacteria group bacterium]
MTDNNQPQSPQAEDPRHQRRIELMQAVFSRDFTNQGEQYVTDPEITKEVEEIFTETEELDRQIQEVATERPLSEINKVDLAILRLVMFESKHKKTPIKVLINEAVELAKEFGTESSPKFVNGVLGKILVNVEQNTKHQDNNGQVSDE